MPTLLAPFLLLAAVLAGLLAPVARSSASSVGGDRSKIHRLEQRIASEGARIQSLVARYDHAQAVAATLQRRIKSTRSHLTNDHRAQAHAEAALRKVAVAAYVSGGVGAPSLLTSSASNQQMATVYAAVAGDRLKTAANSLESAQAQTRRDLATLGHQEHHARAIMDKLRPYQHAAQAAVAAENAQLGHVKGNLHGLLAAASARRARAQRAAEQALAAKTQAVAAPPPVLPSPSSAPGSYADPLRAIGGLASERIDQGVDYRGFGPIYALGDGVVLSIVNGGWPGGTFIAYRLTDGPAAGLTVYAAEDIDPMVQPGQYVTPNTELGVVYAGPDGIETGWAAPGGTGDTMAAIEGQFSGANSTAFGANFSQLLQSLGAPGGILQNSPASGALPGGWPGW